MFKVGDEVVVTRVTNQSGFFRSPLLNKEICEITGFCRCGCGRKDIYELSGYENGTDDLPQGFNEKGLRKVKGQSTESSRHLADLFEERDGVPEFHPQEEKYLEEEKVLKTDADF